MNSGEKGLARLWGCRAGRPPAAERDGRAPSVSRGFRTSKATRTVSLPALEMTFPRRVLGPSEPAPASVRGEGGPYAPRTAARAAGDAPCIPHTRSGAGAFMSPPPVLLDWVLKMSHDLRPRWQTGPGRAPGAWDFGAPFRLLVSGVCPFLPRFQATQVTRHHKDSHPRRVLWSPNAVASNLVHSNLREDDFYGYV